MLRGPYKRYHSSLAADHESMYQVHESKQESINSLQNLDFSELDSSADSVCSKVYSNINSNKLFSTTHPVSRFPVGDDYNSSTEESVTEESFNVYGLPKLSQIWIFFLQPFVDTANHLSSIGFEWHDNGVKIMSKMFPLGCCVDSVARCAILNMKRFNGTYGCTFCEHPTVRIDGVRKYPVMENIPQKRTDKSIKSQMIQAIQNKSKKDTVGVWGTSCLLNMNHFDLSKGMIVDFMHSCLLGVTELYTNIIMTTTGTDYYVGSPSATHIIDKRLLRIKPPTCIAKVPTSICHRNNWKASDYLIWILFGALPSLSGLLSAMYLDHLALFVTALNILLQVSILIDEFKVAEKLLVKFVFYFNKFFGDEHMNYNVHLLLNLSDTVKNWGPLWAINTFPFED